MTFGVMWDIAGRLGYENPLVTAIFQDGIDLPALKKEISEQIVKDAEMLEEYKACDHAQYEVVNRALLKLAEAAELNNGKVIIYDRY